MLLEILAEATSHLRSHSAVSSYHRRANADLDIETGAAVGHRSAALASLQWEDDVLAGESSGAPWHARPQLAGLDQLARRAEGTLRVLRAPSKLASIKALASLSTLQAGLWRACWVIEIL